jgi:hypothetical protein
MQMRRLVVTLRWNMFYDRMPLSTPHFALSCPSDGVALFKDIGSVDLDFFHRTVLLVRLSKPQLLDHLHAALDPAKYCMLSIEPWRRRKRNKELAPIRIRTRVRHAEYASTCVLQSRRYFVLELVAVDRCAASPGARRIATLYHEVRYYTVEH